MSYNRKKRGRTSLYILITVLFCALTGIIVYSVTSDKRGGKASFESSVPPPQRHTIENVKHIYQVDKWPTGCESVSTVMALQFAGIDITVDDFIDNYLDKTPLPFDPYKSFGGDPRDQGGFGCYAPVIKNALDKVLKNKKLKAYQFDGVPLDTLLSDYIAKDIPVIFWGSRDMLPTSQGQSWEFENRVITWIKPEHCLLLIGYTEDSCIFCDPLKTESTTVYPKNEVEAAYRGLLSQAVVIK